MIVEIELTMLNPNVIFQSYVLIFLVTWCFSANNLSTKLQVVYMDKLHSSSNGGDLVQKKFHQLSS